MGIEPIKSVHYAVALNHKTIHVCTIVFIARIYTVLTIAAVQHIRLFKQIII